MTFEKILFSKSVLISFAIILVFSIVLTFFPLIGTLGFEYSAITAILLSFLAVIIAAGLISSDSRSRVRNKSFLSSASSIFFINLILLLIPLVVGLLSSTIKADCYIKEGLFFFLLIPTISVFFSTSIGLLWGYIFGRKGIILGLITIFLIALYALWKLYSGVSIFVYNPVFGFFPGPLYDEAIPITLTLVISRLTAVLIGIVILLALNLADGVRRNTVRIWNFLILSVLVIAVIAIYINESEIGTYFDREYITQNALSGSIETDNFIIYYDPGDPEAKNIELIAMDHEWRYKQIKEELNLKSDNKIISYIYPDIETRKRLIGAGETTIANPVHNEIHLIYDSFPHPILKHELVHVMAGEFGNNVLKISPKIGLLEGIAVAVDWRGQKYNPHQWAKVMTELEMAPQVEDIVGFGFWHAPSEISYTIMGSFSRYLIDTYGTEKYKTAYQTGNFSAYDKSLRELSDEWQEFLNTVDTPPEIRAIAEARFNRPSIFQATCPRKIAEIKTKGYEKFEDENFYGARKLFSEALEYNPSDPNLIYWLAYSYYFNNEYDRVIEITDSFAPETQIEKDLLTNLKGNSKWQLGNLDEAADIFKNLQNQQLSDFTNRELEIKIAAISEDPEVEESLRKFFGTRDDVLQLSYLQNSTMADPLFAPSYYLKGRLLYNKGEFEKAAPEFIRAYLLGLPTYRLENENLKLLGISLFANSRFDQSIPVFNEYIRLENNKAAKKYAQDFIERAKWMKELETSQLN